MNSQIDVRPALPSIGVPALVLHRTGDADSSVDEGRYLAEHIPGAKFVELAGVDHVPFIDGDQIIDEVEEFLTGVRRGPEPDRVLATVVFTDIVGASAERPSWATAPGATSWRRTMRRFGASSCASVATKSTPRVTASSRRSTARPGRSAAPVRSAKQCTRLASRFEPACTPASASGSTASSAASRCTSAPESRRKPAAGEVLVSQTVKDLVAGSGIEFEDRGTHELKGVPGEWRLYSVAST